MDEVLINIFFLCSGPCPRLSSARTRALKGPVCRICWTVVAFWGTMWMFPHTCMQRMSSPGALMSDINEHIDCEKIFYLSSNKAEIKGCLVCIHQSLKHDSNTNVTSPLLGAQTDSHKIKTQLIFIKVSVLKPVSRVCMNAGSTLLFLASVLTDYYKSTSLNLQQCYALSSTLRQWSNADAASVPVIQ